MFSSIAITIMLLSTSISSSLSSSSSCGTCQFTTPLGQDQCDASTACTGTSPTLPNIKYCACRVGYKADNADNGNTYIQFRLSQQSGRVFALPGISCNTLCDNYSSGTGENACSEVSMVNGPTCQKAEGTSGCVLSSECLSGCCASSKCISSNNGTTCAANTTVTVKGSSNGGSTLFSQSMLMSAAAICGLVSCGALFL